MKIFNKVTSINFWIKFFLIWLLLQFVVYTFVTFKLWIDNSYMTIIRAWKEILIAWMIWYLLSISIKKRSIKRLFQDKRIAYLQIIFLLTLVVTFLISIVRHGQSIWLYLMAFKYDLFWFVIFFTFYHISSFISADNREELIQWYSSIMKILLVLWAIWWLTVNAYPYVFEFLGYSTKYYEADVWIAPPIMYWTQMTHWILRNQLIFERPISYWFYLIAFFPLFYLHFLKRRSIKKTRHWRGLFMFSVITTFARSARWAIVIELMILGFIIYNRALKKFFIAFVLPILIILWWLVAFWQKDLLFRYASNSGHLELVVEAIEKIGIKPILGYWAATAGPWSHQQWNKNLEFNPENQYLQIIVEFWLVWFFLWFILYCYFVFVGFKPVKELRSDKKSWSKKYRQKYYSDQMVVWLSTWMVWISIAWLVLHSFSDRMITYPLMAIFWIAMYSYYHKSKIEKK